jgi:hypothetical protein
MSTLTRFVLAAVLVLAVFILFVGFPPQYRHLGQLTPLEEAAAKRAANDVLTWGTDPNPFPFYGLAPRVDSLQVDDTGQGLCTDDNTVDRGKNLSQYDAIVEFRFLGLIRVGPKYEATCYGVHEVGVDMGAGT